MLDEREAAMVARVDDNCPITADSTASSPSFGISEAMALATAVMAIVSSRVDISPPFGEYIGHR